MNFGVVTVTCGSGEDTPGVGTRGLRAPGTSAPGSVQRGREARRARRWKEGRIGFRGVQEKGGHHGEAGRVAAAWKWPRRKEVSVGLPVEVGGPRAGSQAAGCEGGDLWLEGGRFESRLLVMVTEFI